MNAPFFPPESSAQSVPAADVTLSSSRPDEYRHASYPVRRPAEEVDEFLVECRASVLQQVRAKLEKIKNTNFTLAEVILTAAATTGGTWLGAFSSSITYTSDPWLWRLYFAFLPFVALALALIYFFKRQQTLSKASDLATEVLAALPDPKNTK